MTEEMTIAIISASAVIIAAIIAARATIKAARIKRPKHKMKKTFEPLDIPEIPHVDKNPFDLDPKIQEYGNEDYIEALGTRLMESRSPSDVEIRKIKK